MIRFVLAASVAMVSAPAFADGHPPAASTDISSADKIADWTGWYAGAQYDFLDGDAAIGGALDGDVVGVFAGYRQDFGDFVLGGEIDYSVGDFGIAGVTLDVDSLLRVGIELGYDVGPALIYATVGYARLDLSAVGVTADGDGVYYGLGVDFMVSDSVSLGIELLRHDFDNFNGNSYDITSVGLNIAYRF